MGSRVSLNRFFGVFYKFRHEVRASWHRILLVLLYKSMASGKCKALRTAPSLTTANAIVDRDMDMEG